MLQQRTAADLGNIFDGGGMAMGLREAINKNPTITTAATIGLIVVMVVWLAWRVFLGGDSGGYVSGELKGFYTKDDGATYYVDSFTKRYEEDLVIANVFTCDEGKTKFVGYVERYLPDARAAMKAAYDQAAKGMFTGAGTNEMIISNGTEVKAPKTGKWVKRNSSEGNAVITVNCPGGKGFAEAIAPE